MALSITTGLYVTGATIPLNIYHVQVSFSVSDPSKLYEIVVSYEELAPTTQADPSDDGYDPSADPMLNAAPQLTTQEQIENDSAFNSIQPESGLIDPFKFRYGDGNPWNVVLAVDGQTGGNYTAVFTILDRGILTNGYHILVEAMDRQGNINSVEKSGALEKNWWEKLADKVASWLNVLGAIARAFLAWLVEAVGPVIGFVLGLIVSIAKNIVHMFFGLPSMIEMVMIRFGRSSESPDTCARYANPKVPNRLRITQVLNPFRSTSRWEHPLPG